MDDLDRTQIIDNLLKAGDYEAAENFASSVEEEWQSAESLAQVARTLVSVNKLGDARRIWEKAITTAQAGENSDSSQDSLDSSSVLWEIAEDMALAGEMERACKVASQIKNGQKKEGALQELEDIANGGRGSFYKIRAK